MQFCEYIYSNLYWIAPSVVAILSTILTIVYVTRNTNKQMTNQNKVFSRPYLQLDNISTEWCDCKQFFELIYNNAYDINAKGYQRREAFLTCTLENIGNSTANNIRLEYYDRKKQKISLSNKPTDNCVTSFIKGIKPNKNITFGIFSVYSNNNDICKVKILYNDLNKNEYYFVVIIKLSENSNGDKKVDYEIENV
ncbi:MAG: hypothetical protein KAQ68_06475 [Clostridiales bacterium]|nr:hypothetical protein [Clostridiales bacterium]